MILKNKEQAFKNTYIDKKKSKQTITMDSITMDRQGTANFGMLKGKAEGSIYK